jgi:hypothetical protein
MTTSIPVPCCYGSCMYNHDRWIRWWLQLGDRVVVVIEDGKDRLVTFVIIMNLLLYDDDDEDDDDINK